MTTEKRRIPINGRHGHETGPNDVASEHETGLPADTPGAGVVEPDAAGVGPTSAESEASVPGASDPVDTARTVAPASEADPLSVLTAERDAYLDSLLRLQAEFDNYRKRSQRELSDARTRARSGLIGEFLPVFDNLTRALDAAEHHEEGKVLTGVRLTHSLFADLLRKEGVSVVDPMGSPFDPHLHEAVASLPSDEDEGVVIQVLERGYTAGDTVLRPARVAVSAGPAATATGGE